MLELELFFRKKTLWFVWPLCCCLFHFTALGQTHTDTKFKTIASIDTMAKFLAIDPLDNLYLVTHRNELLKYDSNGKFLYRYSNKSFGNDFQLDVSDPLRVLIFYPPFQQIIILNSTLSEIANHAFDNLSQQITLAATSYDNVIWVYEQNNQELHKLSGDFTDEYPAGNIYQQTGIITQPQILRISDQYLYLYDEKVGILQFDRFGSYIKTIVIEPVSAFQVKMNDIIYLKNDSLVKINQRTYQQQTEHLPFKDIHKIAIGNKIMAVVGNKIYICLLDP